MLALTWVISITISSPIALGMNYTDRRAEFPTLCTFYNSDFLIFSSMGSFYIPSIVMILLYWRVFRAIRLRARKSSSSVSRKAAKHPVSVCCYCCYGDRRGGGTGNGSRRIGSQNSVYFAGNHVVNDDRRVSTDYIEEPSEDCPSRSAIGCAGGGGGGGGGRGGGGRGGIRSDCCNRVPAPIAEETSFDREAACSAKRRTQTAEENDDDEDDDDDDEVDARHPVCECTDSAIVKDAGVSVLDSGADLSPDRIVYTVSGSLATAMTSDGTVSPIGSLPKSHTVDSRYGFLAGSPPSPPHVARASFADPPPPPPSSSSLVSPAPEHMFAKKVRPEVDRKRKNSNRSRHASRKHSSKFDLRFPHKAIRARKEKSANRRERKATKTLAIVLGSKGLNWN